MEGPNGPAWLASQAVVVAGTLDGLPAPGFSNSQTSFPRIDVFTWAKLIDLKRRRHPAPDRHGPSVAEQYQSRQLIERHVVPPEDVHELLRLVPLVDVPLVERHALVLRQGGPQGRLDETAGTAPGGRSVYELTAGLREDGLRTRVVVFDEDAAILGRRVACSLPARGVGAEQTVARDVNASAPPRKTANKVHSPAAGPASREPPAGRPAAATSRLLSASQAKSAQRNRKSGGEDESRTMDKEPSLPVGLSVHNVIARPERKDHYGATRQSSRAGLLAEGDGAAAGLADAPPPTQSCPRKAYSKWTAVYAKHSFLILVIVAILVAYAYPPLGAKYLAPDITATWIAVMFIFVLAGMGIKTEEFAKAFQRLGFNAFVQVFNFGACSGIVFGFSRLMLMAGALPQSLADGMTICACLPITVNMVLVLTKSAGGDEASAIFNAAFGNLTGVFLSPALIL
ncbi:hypothetical protein THAOC_37158, partial [Thalassiosira oceanica]